MMRPERIGELQKLLVQFYPEYFTWYKNIWGGNIFSYKESDSEEGRIVINAVYKFEHLIAL